MNADEGGMPFQPRFRGTPRSTYRYMVVLAAVMGSASPWLGGGFVVFFLVCEGIDSYQQHKEERRIKDLARRARENPDHPGVLGVDY